MTGLQIFNAFPSLHIGQESGFDHDNAILAIFARETEATQRALIGDRLVPEYSEADLRQGMRPNGSADPQGADDRRLADGTFSNYRLTVTGLVEAPLSLATLAALPPAHRSPAMTASKAGAAFLNGKACPLASC